jgi:hypothetical protein
MRSRGEGPRWSGHGKWTRYLRTDVLRWLSSLPTRQSQAEEHLDHKGSK